MIEGQPDQLELLIAWEAIYEQFLDAMNDRDGLHKIKLRAQINGLEFDYKLIQLCIQYLKVGYKPNIAEILTKHIRVDGRLNPEDQASYFRLLQTTKNRAQRLQVKIGEKKAELAIIEKQSTGSTVRPTKNHFDNLIAQVSRFMKFYIDRRQVSIGEFTSFYMQMQQESEAIQKFNTQNRR